eukprot:gnl/MRDRNA2_/MRDRNA2_157870_c0_seq1.p1 gnl/MRDRNA2_/MRDRNA2_157870_c0~~gnl/MRDRNA2_/MRDRNA2_157870_c0_seq1.p1  ORF type:complete len:219 (-),score=28.94 gnl/MRDRNA2_/MRDRNA2_157870_c0_seq1:26-682(-)
MYNEHKASLSERALCHPIDTLSFGDAQTPPLFQEDALGPTAGGAEPIIGFQKEAFCPVVLEVGLDTAATLEAFLPVAVDFCHTKCWGSLTCTLVVDDATKSSHREALDQIVDSMKFGVIGINFPPAAANAFPLLSWGAYPGHTNRDIQSGMGHVGNFGCYDNLQNVIMESRFRNLHQFKLAPSRRPAFRKRALRLGDLFLYRSWWRLVKFASAHFLGL